jgi:DNA-binding transcriptional LysR family regulator
MPWNDRVRRRFKLRDLDILMAVIDAGSMGKAAIRLNMAQPAVSKAVADLEHILGVRLLDRSRQGVEATAYGAAFLKRGVAIFDELRQGFQDIDFLTDPTAGELRLGATEAVAAAMIAPLVDRLSQRYSRMTFHVVITANPESLCRELAARKYELVVSRVVRPLAEEYSVETLFHDPLMVVTGPNSPLQRRRRIGLAELVDQRWVLPPDSFFSPIVAEAFRAAGLEPPRLTVAATTFGMRHELIATGRYLSAAPGFLLRLPRRHPTLRPLLELPNTRAPIAIITLKNRSLSGLAQLFIENLRTFTKPLAKS